MGIKELRIKKGWSQEYLANITGLSTRTIQRIEKDNNASTQSLSLLAKAFEIEYEKFMESINSSDETKEEIKKSILDDKKLLIFISVNFMLFCINMATNTNHFWFIYPLLGWGIPFFISRYKKEKNNIK